MLNVPDGKAELQHFKNKWMTPHQMIDVSTTGDTSPNDRRKYKEVFTLSATDRECMF